MISGLNDDFETILPKLLKKEMLEKKIKDIIGKEDYKRFLLGKEEEIEEEINEYSIEKTRESIIVLSAVILYRRFYSSFLRFLNSGFSKEFSVQSAINCSLIENVSDLEVFLEDIFLLSWGKTLRTIGLNDNEWKGLEVLKSMVGTETKIEAYEEEEDEDEFEEYEYVPATLGGTSRIEEKREEIIEPRMELLRMFVESASEQAKIRLEDFYELIEREDFVLQLFYAHLDFGSFIFNGKINENKENVLLVFYRKSIFKDYLGV